jgi:hypothetical protein
MGFRTFQERINGAQNGHERMSGSNNTLGKDKWVPEPFRKGQMRIRKSHERISGAQNWSRQDKQVSELVTKG